MTTESKFKVGDIVEAFGCRGVVYRIDKYVWVRFENGNMDAFYEDGKHQHWHKEPTLKLIERPKKKVTKTVERCVNVYPDGPNEVTHLSREDADNEAGSTRIACVKLTGTYEVEE